MYRAKLSFPGRMIYKNLHWHEQDHDSVFLFYPVEFQKSRLCLEGTVPAGPWLSYAMGFP